MSNKRNSKTDPDEPTVYQIMIEGHLDRLWTDWFGGLSITLEENGDTLLTALYQAGRRSIRAARVAEEST